MAKCSFCAGAVPEARGKMFVRNDGKIFYFCNSKCQKNWRMGREGKYKKWTEAFRKERGTLGGASAAQRQEAKAKEAKENAAVKPEKPGEAPAQK